MSKYPYTILNTQEYRGEVTPFENAFSSFEIGIPFLDCADKTIQQIYYFRWHIFCKHIRETPEGMLLQSFMTMFLLHTLHLENASIVG